MPEGDAARMSEARAAATNDELVEALDLTLRAGAGVRVQRRSQRRELGRRQVGSPARDLGKEGSVRDRRLVRAAAQVTRRSGTREDRQRFVAFVRPQRPQGMKEREGVLALPKITERVLPDRTRVALEAEEVVLDLKCYAEEQREATEVGADVIGASGREGPRLDGRDE